MSDRELIDAMTQAARDERRATTDLIALLGELDERRLYLAEGCSSLFTYCTQVLHLSEHAAYHRIEAARAVRRFPVILELLTEGAMTLTTVAMLRPHLTPDNLSSAEANIALRCRAHNGFEAERAGLKLWRPEPTRSSFAAKLPRAASAD